MLNQRKDLGINTYYDLILLIRNWDRYSWYQSRGLGVKLH